MIDLMSSILWPPLLKKIQVFYVDMRWVLFFKDVQGIEEDKMGKIILSIQNYITTIPLYNHVFYI